MQGAARALRERQTELKTRLSHLEQEKQVSSRRRREVLGRWAAHASSPASQNTTCAACWP